MLTDTCKKEGYTEEEICGINENMPYCGNVSLERDRDEFLSS